MGALLLFLAGFWISAAPSPKMAMVLMPTTEARLSVARSGLPPSLGHFRWGVRADSLCFIGSDGYVCWQAAAHGRDSLVTTDPRGARLWTRLPGSPSYQLPPPGAEGSAVAQ